MSATHGEGAYGNGVGVTTPIEHKMAQVGEIVKTTTPNLIRSGVFYNGVTNLVVGKADMSYDVLPFSCASTRGASSGVLKWANDGTVNVPTTAAPGSNSRIDLVYAWHREFALDGTNSDPVIGVVQGSAAAIPTAPSLASFPGAIELARITVGAGITATTSATITNTCPFTTVDGSPIPVRNTTELGGLTGFLQGQEAKIVPAGGLFRYYDAYHSSTNPLGALAAGWYPAPGQGPAFHVTATATENLGSGAQVIKLAYPATADNLGGFTSWTQSTGSLVLPYTGEYDVTALARVTGGTAENQIWVGSNQVLTVNDGSAGVPVLGVVKGNAGDVLTHRLFTSGSVQVQFANGQTQLAVRWRGVRRS